MTYSAAAAAEVAFEELKVDYPGLLQATRANPAQGVATFNVPKALLRNVLAALGDLAVGTVVSDAATGFDGGGAELQTIHTRDTPILAPVLSLATRCEVPFLTLGWSGAQARPWFYRFNHAVTEGFRRSVTLAYPDPPQSPLFRSVTSATLGPALFPVTLPALFDAMLARFDGDGRFTVGDAGQELTPQIRRLLLALAASVSASIGDLQAVLSYTGAAGGNPAVGSALSATVE